MITLKVDKLNREISQKLYDEIIESVDIHLLECTCKRHNMVVHGYYTRKLKTNNGNIELVILRVRCKDCGRTHAVLISFIVPYQSVILHFDIDTYWIYTANYFREIICHVYKSVLYIIARFFRFAYDTMKA